MEYKIFVRCLNYSKGLNEGQFYNLKISGNQVWDTLSSWNYNYSSIEEFLKDFKIENEPINTPNFLI